MIDKNMILSILKRNKYCVLATASSTAKTQLAVVSYTVTDDFTILMSTNPHTRKTANIATNNQASIVIGGTDGSVEIQIDGQIRFLEEPQATQSRNTILTIHPELKDYISDTNKIIEFKPIWLRYSDFTVRPPEILEITDFS